MSDNIEIKISIKDAFSAPLKSFSNQIDKFGKSIKGVVGNSFKYACKQIHKFESDIINADKTFQDFSSLLSEDFRKAAKSGAEGLKNTARYAYELALDSAQAGVKVSQMSSQLGMSNKTFQEMDYVFSQSGLNIENFQDSMKSLSQAVENTSKGNSEAGKIFKNLGVSVTDANGKLKDQGEIFKESLEALQRMPDGLNKAVYAQKLFGDEGRNLMPMLSSNNKSLKEIADNANAYGLIMSDNAIGASGEFSQSLDTINRAGEALKVSFGIALLPLMQGLADAVINNMPAILSVADKALSGLSQIVGFLSDNLDILIPVVGGIFTAIQALGVISTVANAFKLFDEARLAVQIGMELFNLTILGCPLGALLLAIGGISAALIMLVTHWDSVKQSVDLVIEAVQRFLGLKPKLGDSLKKLTPEQQQKVNDYNASHRKTYISASNALGTPYFQGGFTRINEGGREEIVNLPSGSQIIPHSMLEQNKKANAAPVININVDGNLIGSRELFVQFADMLAKDLTKKMAVVV